MVLYNVGLDMDYLKNYKSVAIMGGTFDPIHYGHLVAAEAVRDCFSIELIIFMPTGKPAHKKGLPVTDAEKRYSMTVMATQSNPNFQVSRIEIERKGMSYTIDTINEVSKHLAPDASLYFITGADAVHQILNWKNSAELLNICTFVAVTRPGFKKSDLQTEIKKLKSGFNGKLKFLEIPSLDISSTDIRKRVKNGNFIKYLLPEPVEYYIKKEKLYSSYTIEQMKEYAKSCLSEKRFNHTLGVAEEAVKLAMRYGANQQKAETAAVLHDCAKELTAEEKLKKCNKYGIPLDDILIKQPDLTHSFIAAAIAQDLFCIEDDEILSAIRYHTTGRRNMTLLDKIIYLADYIEPTRKPFDGILKAREKALSDLDQAVKISLLDTLEYNNKKGCLIHPLSYEALEDYSHIKY